MSSRNSPPPATACSASDTRSGMVSATPPDPRWPRGMTCPVRWISSWSMITGHILFVGRRALTLAPSHTAGQHGGSAPEPLRQLVRDHVGQVVSELGQDRKRDVQGKRVAVRVNTGGA